MNKIKYIFNIYRKEFIVGFVILICLVSILGGSYYVYAKENNDVEYLADNLEVIEPKEELIKEEEITQEEKEEVEETKKIRVDIKGQVVSPGVYEVTSEDRVIDVITKAGGLLETADTSVNNLSRRVWDEMVIIIYSKEEVESFTSTKEVELEEMLESEEIKDIILNDATLKEEDIVTNQDSYGATPKEEIKREEQKTPDSSKNSTTEKLTSKISINTAPAEELMKLTGIGKTKAEAIISYRNTNGNFTTLEDLMKVKGIGEKIFAKIKDNITL